VDLVYRKLLSGSSDSDRVTHPVSWFRRECWNSSTLTNHPKLINRIGTLQISGN
jgi:hypothetical protein